VNEAAGRIVGISMEGSVARLGDGLGRGIRLRASQDAAGAARFGDRLEARIEPGLRLARAILGNHDDAEDALHDAVVAAWRAWPGLRDESRFEIWFERILVNGCRDRLRRRRRGPRFIAITGEPPGAPLVDPWPGLADGLALELAFAELDPDHAVVAALRFYRDLTVDEIAALVGVPPGTVKSRLHHATKRLRAALGSREAPDD
jgi:DNA-directed RNA polymerase specialized sigma24 family protein